jgi:hypothetical protein
VIQKIDLQKISTIIDGKSAEIEMLDNTVLMETVGVANSVPLRGLKTPSEQRRLGRE